jgi:hypothetical protein
MHCGSQLRSVVIIGSESGTGISVTMRRNFVSTFSTLRGSNGKTFAIYALSIIPLLLINIILSMFGPCYVLADLLLIPLALYLLGQSFRKWDRIESTLF